MFLYVCVFSVCKHVQGCTFVYMDLLCAKFSMCTSVWPRVDLYEDFIHVEGVLIGSTCLGFCVSVQSVGQVF